MLKERRLLNQSNPEMIVSGLLLTRSTDHCEIEVQTASLRRSLHLAAEQTHAAGDADDPAS